MQTQTNRTIARMSDEELARELAFAEVAVYEEDPASVKWLEDLKAEKSTRTDDRRAA